MALRWLGRILRRQSSPSTFDLRALQAHVGYRFRDHTLLEQALKHRSYVYAHQGTGVESNERLEYLGDAVMDLLVAEFLYREYQSLREGDLTQMKSLVVSRTILAAKASSIDLDHFILLSAEERRAGGVVQPSILADALEAVIGAIYLDGGLEAARRTVHDVLLQDFEELHTREDFVNFKSRLLEHTQSQGSGHPKYHVHNEDGPDHDKLFSVNVSVTGETLGSGQGRSKKEAQQMAARDALKRLGQL